MNLTEHYNLLYEKSSKAILEGGYLIDDQIDSPSDNRFGITLLIKPSKQITRNIQAFLEELRAIDPAQYYYPASDMHVTVLSIISCYVGFELSRISVQDYVNLIQESLTGLEAIDIQFTGITASPAAVMIQGFPRNNALDELRNRLRNNFRSSGLEETIDTRYTIATAHVTAMRFRTQLKNSERFVAVLERYRQHVFGHCRQIIWNWCTTTGTSANGLSGVYIHSVCNHQRFNNINTKTNSSAMKKVYLLLLLLLPFLYSCKDNCEDLECISESAFAFRIKSADSGENLFPGNGATLTIKDVEVYYVKNGTKQAAQVHARPEFVEVYLESGITAYFITALDKTDTIQVDFIERPSSECCPSTIEINQRTVNGSKLDERPWVIDLVR